MKHKYLIVSTILLVFFALMMPTKILAQSKDCIHCGKSRVDVSFEGTNVEVINTSIDKVVDWLSTSRGSGKVLSQADSMGLCNMVAMPSTNIEVRIASFHRMTDDVVQKYGVSSFMELYHSVRCPPGLSMVSAALLYGNTDVALELFKMRAPLNSVNEHGQTDLDYAVKRVKDLRKGKTGSAYTIQKFFTLFRGKKKNYDVPLLTCEIEKTCVCPFTLPNLGAECTPPQS